MSTSQKLFSAEERNSVNLNNTKNPFSPLSADVDATASKVYIAFTIAGGLLLSVCVAFAVKSAIYSSGDFDRFEKSRKSRPEHRRLDPLSNFTMLRKMACYVLLTVNCFSQGCVEKMLMSFLMTFTVKYLTWSKKNGSLATTVFWVGFAGGRFLGIFLIKIIKPKILLLVTLLGLLMTFGAMLIVDFISWPEEFWWVLIGASGLFLAPLFASFVSWIDRALTPVTGKLMSFVYIWLFVGTMTHMALLGYLFEALTPLWFLYLLIIHTVLLIVSFLSLCLLSKAHIQQNNTASLLPAR